MILLRQLTISICGLLFSVSVSAQKISLNPERKVSKKTEKITASIAEKVLEINKDATNDVERVESIYGWIRKNIGFDTCLYAYIENIGYKSMPGKKSLKKRFEYLKLSYQVTGKGKLQEMQSAEQTFKRKKGISNGIAELFNSMCEFANIESYVVLGYAKGEDYVLKDQFHHANHSWNAVKVIDTWHLIDPTWGWLNATPEEFAMRHGK
jgi:transglutaminase/protease-like cytokinesis protein 3